MRHFFIPTPQYGPHVTNKHQIILFWRAPTSLEVPVNALSSTDPYFPLENIETYCGSQGNNGEENQTLCHLHKIAEQHDTSKHLRLFPSAPLFFCTPLRKRSWKLFSLLSSPFPSWRDKSLNNDQGRSNMLQLLCSEKAKGASHRGRQSRASHTSWHLGVTGGRRGRSVITDLLILFRGVANGQLIL